MLYNQAAAEDSFQQVHAFLSHWLAKTVAGAPALPAPLRYGTFPRCESTCRTPATIRCSNSPDQCGTLPWPEHRRSALGHRVSIGAGPADFVAAMREAEALVTDVSVIKAMFPCPAPNLKLIFLTNAGLDGLAPFTWLPPGVALLNNRGTHAAKSGEFAIMSILMLANRIPVMVTNQRHGVVAQNLGFGARRPQPDRRWPWHARRRHRRTRHPLRHARHRRARQSSATSGLRKRGRQRDTGRHPG